ncbi:cytochrome P450 [Tricladium varicosporioides]|nr:cytochrome P450 [Hymenoscyphus varicosporioides]
MGLLFFSSLGLLSLLLLWRSWRFTISPIFYPHAAKELPYWTPFLGHAISFFLDSDATFTRGRLYFRNSRKPFGITVAGSNIYVLTSAADAFAMSSNTHELVFDAYVKDMMASMGATPDGITKMWEPRPPYTKVDDHDHRYSNPRGKPLGQISEEIFRKQLHPGIYLTHLQTKFLTSIHRALTWERLSAPGKTVLSSSFGEHTVSLLQWTQATLLKGATDAFFGTALLRDNPNLLDNFSEFDERSWQLSYKIPKPFSNEMQVAKQSSLDALTTYFKLPASERPGACWLVQTMEIEMRAAEISEYDMAANLMMAYWVINGNAWKVCFWIMAYLLQDPGLCSEVQNEVKPFVTNSTSPNELSDSLDQCSKLVSVYQETLRVVTSSISIRNIVKPLKLGGELLRPGSRVLIPYRQILMDEEVFGSDAAYFNPNRFLNDKFLAKCPSFRPFGSGTTHCPGRFLAQKEVLTFVALAVSRFDVQKAKELGEKNAFPRLEVKKPCLGIMAPVKGDDVRVTVRQVDS